MGYLKDPVMWLLALGLALVLILSGSDDAKSHMSPGGMQYPSDCCDPLGEECSPVDPKYITESETHFFIDIPAEGHPLLNTRVKRGWQKFFGERRNPKWKDATDGEYHACCKNQACFCIIVPPKGF